MRLEKIPLLPAALIGHAYELAVFHFGQEGCGRKVYIQGSLHADELPGALTAHYLKQRLQTLEQQGRLQDVHIVLLPLANPIGIQQNVHYLPFGRFDLMTGRNFNRLGELDLYAMARQRLDADRLGSDASANVALIRAAVATGLSQYQPTTLIEALHHHLVSLSFDADLLLDLHCDSDALLHLYTLPGLWPRFEPLARYLGSQAQLLADDSHANSFDEANSTLWLKLQKDYPNAAIPLACAAATVELRGVNDLRHDLAEGDAAAIVAYLAQQGFLDWQARPPLPDLLAPPTPLAGVETVLAPANGIVVFRQAPGARVAVGDHLLDLLNPVSGEVRAIHATVAGLIYARNKQACFATTGMELMNIAGAEALPHGPRLSP